MKVMWKPAKAHQIHKNTSSGQPFQIQNIDYVCKLGTKGWVHPNHASGAMDDHMWCLGWPNFTQYGLNMALPKCKCTKKKGYNCPKSDIKIGIVVFRIYLSHYMHQSSHFTTHNTFSHFCPISAFKKFNLIQIYFTPFRKKIKGSLWSKFPTPSLCSWVHHDPPRLWPNFGRIPKKIWGRMSSMLPLPISISISISISPNPCPLL